MSVLKQKLLPLTNLNNGHKGLNIIKDCTFQGKEEFALLQVQAGHHVGSGQHLEVSPQIRCHGPQQPF